MTTNQMLIEEYADILMGKKNQFNIKSYGLHPRLMQTLILDVFKYAFEVLLNWTPENVYRKNSMDLLKRLKLDQLYKYLEFPKFIEPDVDVYYLAKMMYPRDVNITDRDIITEIYKKVYYKEKAKFPKEFFSGSDARVRAAICLQYAIMNFFVYEDIRDLYEQFANNKKTVGWLRTINLAQPYSILYKSTLDYLHESLPDSDRSEYYYNYYKFNSMYTSKLHSLRKSRKKND